MSSSGKVKFGIVSKDTTSSRINSSSSGGAGVGAGVGAGYASTFYHTQTKLLQANRNSKRGADANEDDNKFVENLLKKVFFDTTNKTKITQNLDVLTESRFSKAFKTFNGGDVKKPDEKLKSAMTVTFGTVGYEFYKMLLRIMNVSSKERNLFFYDKFRY